VRLAIGSSVVAYSASIVIVGEIYNLLQVDFTVWHRAEECPADTACDINKR
jgi:hypothetical protein